MALSSRTIKQIYSGKVALKYDFSMPPFFLRWKKKAFEHSSLKSGDRVLVFCCGTGLDFKPILNKIGAEGSIVAVDFSSEMLAEAQKKIINNNWKNIELIQADVTTFATEKTFDIAVCTLGLSIIPDFKAAFQNLVEPVKDKGQIIIGDMQLASGWWALLNPITILMAKKFGGSEIGHQNSLQIQDWMTTRLVLKTKCEFFFRSYYFCISNKK